MLTQPLRGAGHQQPVFVSALAPAQPRCGAPFAWEGGGSGAGHAWAANARAPGAEAAGARRPLPAAARQKGQQCHGTGRVSFRGRGRSVPPHARRRPPPAIPGRGEAVPLPGPGPPARPNGLTPAPTTANGRPPSPCRYPPPLPPPPPPPPPRRPPSAAAAPTSRRGSPTPSRRPAGAGGAGLIGTGRARRPRRGARPPPPSPPSPLRSLTLYPPPGRGALSLRTPPPRLGGAAGPHRPGSGEAPASPRRRLRRRGRGGVAQVRPALRPRHWPRPRTAQGAGATGPARAAVVPPSAPPAAVLPRRPGPEGCVRWAPVPAPPRKPRQTRAPTSRLCPPWCQRGPRMRCACSPVLKPPGTQGQPSPDSPGTCPVLQPHGHRGLSRGALCFPLGHLCPPTVWPSKKAGWVLAPFLPAPCHAPCQARCAGLCRDITHLPKSLQSRKMLCQGSYMCSATDITLSALSSSQNIQFTRRELCRRWV